MTIQNCVFCRFEAPLETWDKDALIYNLNICVPCDKHKMEVDAEIARRPKDPIKYVLKAEPKTVSFVPKEGIKNPPNFQDREPNDGSLIE